MDSLIVISDTEEGRIYSIEGSRGLLRAVGVEEVDHDMDIRAKQKQELFVCMAGDVPLAVAELSKYHVGRELKVYTLTQSFTRMPGELKNLIVTKDGKLPF